MFEIFFLKIKYKKIPSYYYFYLKKKKKKKNTKKKRRKKKKEKKKVKLKCKIPRKPNTEMERGDKDK